MQVRASTEMDTDRIVSLLKLSLGEGSSEKSARYWDWKHRRNPFGISPVLLAEEEGELVGVRAMMRWKWAGSSAQYNGLRAVDTATHPAHQGKGIFSRLTRQMVEMARSEGTHFIFNTPNEQSKPGYLKMGWREAGRLNVGLKFSLPLFRVPLPPPGGNVPETLEELCLEWNERMKKDEGYFTPKSSQYLSWRYADNPLIQYHVYNDKDIYIALHLRQRKRFRELRISELIWRDGRAVGKRIRDLMRHWSSALHAPVISFSPVAKTRMGIAAMSFAIGPTLTVRNLNMPQDWEGDTKWNYCIGDLELF